MYVNTGGTFTSTGCTFSGNSAASVLLPLTKAAAVAYDVGHTYSLAMMRARVRCCCCCGARHIPDEVAQLTHPAGGVDMSWRERRGFQYASVFW